MMAKKQLKGVDGFVKQLEEILSGLPHESQTAAFAETIDKTVSVLTDLGELFRRMPTLERIEKEGILKGLQEMAVFVNALSAAKPRRAAQPKVLDWVKIDGFVNLLQQTPEGDLRAVVKNTKMNKEELLAVLERVGGHPVKSDKVDAVKEKIVSKVISARTAAGIRGGAMP